jgi:hypothetical protein
VHGAIEELPKEVDCRKVLEIELAEIDDMLKTVTPRAKAGDDKAVVSWLRLKDTRLKLLGLFPTVSGGNQQTFNILNNPPAQSVIEVTFQPGMQPGDPRLIETPLLEHAGPQHYPPEQWHHKSPDPEPIPVQEAAPPNRADVLPFEKPKPELALEKRVAKRRYFDPNIDRFIAEGVPIGNPRASVFSRPPRGWMR